MAVPLWSFHHPMYKSCQSHTKSRPPLASTGQDSTPKNQLHGRPRNAKLNLESSFSRQIPSRSFSHLENPQCPLTMMWTPSFHSDFRNALTGSLMLTSEYALAISQITSDFVIISFLLAGLVRLYLLEGWAPVVSRLPQTDVHHIINCWIKTGRKRWLKSDYFTIEI